MAEDLPPAGAMAFKTALDEANKTDKERLEDEKQYTKALKAQIAILEAQ